MGVNIDFQEELLPVKEDNLVLFKRVIGVGNIENSYKMDKIKVKFD